MFQLRLAPRSGNRTSNIKHQTFSQMPHDPRFDKLARLLVTHSTKLKRGEKVLIDAFDIPAEMTVALIRAVREVKALPFVQTHQARVSREMIRGIDGAEFDLIAAHELARM